jgi:hypothetical protein
MIRDLWHEVLLLRVDAGRFVLPAVGPLADRGTEAEYLREVSEEPLRLIEYVVMNDRPFGEIVTADYAIASPLAIDVWGATPLPADPGAAPAAGLAEGRVGLGAADGRDPLERRAVAAPTPRTAPTTTAARPSWSPSRCCAAASSRARRAAVQQHRPLRRGGS